MQEGNVIAAMLMRPQHLGVQTFMWFWDNTGGDPWMWPGVLALLRAFTGSEAVAHIPAELPI